MSANAPLLWFLTCGQQQGVSSVMLVSYSSASPFNHSTDTWSASDIPSKTSFFQNVQKFYAAYHKSYSSYADYREQAADWDGQDRLSFFVILNNFLVINAKECVIIDSWYTSKRAWLLEEHIMRKPYLNIHWK